MKKNGFTLIELVCVLLILGIILMITLSYTNSTSVKSKQNLTDIQQKKIIESAKEYYLREGINKEYESNYADSVCVNINYLITHNYIDSNSIIDPKTSSVIETGSVLIQKSGNQYSYKYKDINCPS